MKIANIQTPKDMTINKNPVETKPDEFTKELSKAINKDSDSNKEFTKSELEKENKELEVDLEDSLVAVLNLPFVDLKEIETIKLDIDPSKIKEVPISIEAVNTLMNEGSPKSINETKPNIENMEHMENIGEVILGVDKSVLVENLVDEIKLEENFEIPNNNKLLEINEEPKKINFSASSNVESESFNMDEKQHKEILVNVLDNKEVTVEIKPNEELNLNEDKDINLLENSQVKNLNKISFEPKIEAQKPVLSNENVQKVNDTIIQLMETTTEGNTNVIKVKLYPEDMGVVDVTLRMEEGKLTAKILVDNEYIRGLFTNRVNELNESLIKQNIHLEKINIDLNLNSNSSNNSGFDLNQEGGFNQGRGNYSNRNQAKYFNRENISTVVNKANIYESGAISILA